MTKPKNRILLKTSLLIIAVIVISFFISLWLPLISLSGKKTDLKVYIAFGFHGNLYHSFRIDTNDEAGFGKDIRIIRKQIEVLDKYNKQGIPVKGSWDIENLFSLQETLPRYAPDIMTNLKRRMKLNGDEMIIMSYNNGLVSAMTPQEFHDSIQLAITNEHGSGLLDLFGKYSPIVRPQEVMTSPGNFSGYQKLGIKSIILYNSAITFDTFRTFVAPLSLEDAHNPIWYHNQQTKERMIVIPAYNVGDLIENVSLAKWARDLHRAQLRGEIKRNVLIFINFDADDEYWYGYKLPAHLKSLPNTGGLDQLIASVKDTPYIQFTTVQEYLDKNPPKSEFSFGQDTADGSFNGYNSWSEKAYVHDYWTELMHDRRNEKIVREIRRVISDNRLTKEETSLLKDSYNRRLRLLSTTNFGMSTPYLARGRERVVEQLITDMHSFGGKAVSEAMAAARARLLKETQPSKANSSQKDLQFINTFYFFQIEKSAALGNGAFINLTIDSAKDIYSQYILKDENKKNLSAYFIEKKTAGKNATLRFYIQKRNQYSGNKLFLWGINKEIAAQRFATKASDSFLENDFIRLNFNNIGHVDSVYYLNQKQLDTNSLIPYVHYDHRFYRPEKLQATILQNGQNGVARLKVKGMFALPKVKHSKPGEIDYIFTLINGVPYLFVEGSVRYPETKRASIIKEDVPALARLIDNRWIEASPLELQFSHHASLKEPFQVIKRNYFEIESSYPVDYFQHSDKNLNLANINHHITSEYIAVVNASQGVAVAMDTTVLANFAFAPLKMTHDSLADTLQMKINPFGTYFGKQYYQPTWGRGYGFEAAFITGQQYASAAKTYNGYKNTFSVMLSFFSAQSDPSIVTDGKITKVPARLRNDMISFAHPPLVISSQAMIPNESKPKLTVPAGFLGLFGKQEDKNGIFFHWEKIEAKPVQYSLQIGTASGRYSQNLNTSDTSFFWNKAVPDQKYYARVFAVLPDGTKGNPTEEIIVQAKAKDQVKKGPQIPILLQLKILMAYLVSLIS